MGFQVPDSDVVLRFAVGHKYHGLEVTTEGVDIRTFLRITGMDGGDGQEALGAQVDRFSKAVKAWNLEDKQGQPIPVSPEAVMAQDQQMVLVLATSWFQSLGGVADDDPLSESSPDGQQSVAALIPMESPLESRAS